MRTWILGTAVVALIAVGCGDDDDDSAHDVDGGDDTAGGGNDGNNGGSSANRGDGGPNGSSGSGAVGDGSQLSGCMTNADCDPGLNCYTFGGYCSAQCATDSDCSSLGANYGCYVPAGGGMMGGIFGGMMGIPGGMMGGAGGATGSGGAPAMTANGTCRISCTGVDDTSCPSGLMCIDVGAGSFRCARPMMSGSGGTQGFPGGAGGAGFFGGAGGMGGQQTPGTTEAFGECMGGGCIEGLLCSSGFGRGYCTQTCMDNGDCTNNPDSGDITPTCGRNGRCVLDCTVDGDDECPDDMTCNRQGGPGGGNNNEDGGAPVAGRCNYSN